MDNLYSSVSKGGCYDTNHYGPRPLPLLKQNYLGEYFTEAEKELVRQNLGIHNDSLVRKFIAEGKFFKDQKAVEGHESIETIYDAISYLFGDVDAENERILELEAESQILNKLVGTKSVPYEFDKNDKKIYLWPELKDIKEGYLYELNSSIQEAFSNIEDVRNSIGTLPDGSDVEQYILDKHNELLEIIGEYKEAFEDFEEVEGFTGNYAQANTPIKSAINDLDYRVSMAESLFSTDINLITSRIESYNNLLNNAGKRINEASSSINDLKNEIDSAKEDFSKKLGVNDTENPTGVYASLKEYNDTLTQDLNDFKLEVSTDLTGVKEEVTEIQASVEAVVEQYKQDLAAERDVLIGTPASEGVPATGMYAIIDSYKTGIREELTSEISEEITEITQAAKESANELNALLNGDVSAEEGDAARKSLEERTSELKEEITRAEATKEETLGALEEAERIASNLKEIKIKTREGVVQTSKIPTSDGPITFEMGALGFYLNGEHLRTFAPGLGHSGDSEDKMAKVITESDGTTKEYRSAFSLNYNSSDTVSAQLKTLQNGEKYRIPTLEFEAKNVIIQDGLDESTSSTSNILKIVMVTSEDYEKITKKEQNTFYFIKQS